MIGKTIRMMAVCVLILSGGAAAAQTLCDRPLHASCVVPQWGQIDPSEDDGSSPSGLNRGGENSSAAAVNIPALDSGRMGNGAHIQLAQLRKPMNVSHAPKLLISDVKRFDRETQVLVRAIERATFDKEGNLKTGEDQIERAVQPLREASKDHQLNLYIKVQRKLGEAENAALIKKARSVNAVIKEAVSDSYARKEVPNS